MIHCWGIFPIGDMTCIHSPIGLKWEFFWKIKGQDAKDSRIKHFLATIAVDESIFHILLHLLPIGIASGKSFYRSEGGGCTFCNNDTFKPTYCQPDIRVKEQLSRGIDLFKAKHPDTKYLAYFQAYTNTYGDISQLIDLYEEALSTPEVIEIGRASCRERV